MRRLFQLMCVLLAALWLPATAHCALEAAGLIAQTCDEGCAGGSGLDDGCGTVESGAYKLSGIAARAPAPDLVVCLGQLCFAELQAEAGPSLQPPPGALFERPHDWIATWSFVRRTAPPSRAPTVLTA